MRVVIAEDAAVLREGALVRRLHSEYRLGATAHIRIGRCAPSTTAAFRAGAVGVPARYASSLSRWRHIPGIAGVIMVQCRLAKGVHGSSARSCDNGSHLSS